MATRKNNNTTVKNETVETAETVKTQDQDQVKESETMDTQDKLQDQPVVDQPAEREFSVDEVLAALEAKTAAAARVEEIQAIYAEFKKYEAIIPKENHSEWYKLNGVTGNETKDIAAAMPDEAILTYATTLQSDASENEQPWLLMLEYQDMIATMTAVNSVRQELGLRPLELKYGRKHSRAASTENGAGIVERKSQHGYLATGEYKLSYKGKRVDVVSTPENITINVQGQEIWNKPQGWLSLDKILKQYVIPACGGTGALGVPDWLLRNNYDPELIILTERPTV